MEDYKYKLSIIIPMYNAEKYIGNCLDSIINSNLQNGWYEIVIVNDGSIDDGPLIAQQYANKYKNITYLSQENKGQSVARNFGIRSCDGEYIWCVDSDDMVGDDFSVLVELLSTHNSIDILAFGLKVITESGEFIRNECNQPNVQHNLLQIGRDAIIAGYDPSSVCALWIRRHFIEEYSLFFKEGITHQDVELTYRLFAEANEVLFTNEYPYIYILHPNSTSQSINPQKKIKYLSDDIVVYQSFMKLASEHETDTELASTIRNRAQNVLFGLVYSLYKNRKHWHSLGINHEVINMLKKNGLYPIHGPFDSWKKYTMSIILNREYLIN